MEIRVAEENDFDEIVSFYNKWNQDNRTLSRLVWQFYSYWPNKGFHVIAKEDNQIIGIQGLMPFPMTMNGIVQLTGKSEDTLVSPKHRGRQILKQLYTLVFQEAKARGYLFI